MNPIFTAPSVHKYDCIDYFHVDPHFGGDEALAELSKALHENGMKLVLDISINHTGSAHKWFNKDGLFFDKSVGAYNNLDSLRDVIYRSETSVLKKWLKPPYSIDGWRFDVADVFARHNEVQLAHELWPGNPPVSR